MSEVACHGHGHAPRPRPPEDNPADLERTANLFRALGDAPRLRMLRLLQQGEWCVTELVTAVGEKFSTVSQRLRVLRGEGLVRRRREGSHIYYSLADQHVIDLMRNGLAHAQELNEKPTGSVSRHHGSKEGQK
jgi:DNA-binding transcriptional ArsR family regulator